jgi:hypothetical protein
VKGEGSVMCGGGIRCTGEGVVLEVVGIGVSVVQHSSLSMPSASSGDAMLGATSINVSGEQQSS